MVLYALPCLSNSSASIRTTTSIINSTIITTDFKSSSTNNTNTATSTITTITARLLLALLLLLLLVLQLLLLPLLKMQHLGNLLILLLNIATSQLLYLSYFPSVWYYIVL